MGGRDGGAGVNWFEESFGERYLRLYAHRDREEARRAIDTLFPAHTLAGRRVLDLACGPGRYLRVLYERGARAVGIDLSPVLLAEAARVFEALDSVPRLVRGDMRRLPFADRCFESTLSMFTSFGYFESFDAHAELAREMARVTSAVIVLDVPNPVVLRRDLVPRSERRADDMRVVERRRVDDDPPRVVKTIELSAPDGDEVVERYEERVMLFGVDELTSMFSEAGFALEDLTGDYDGAPFDLESSGRSILRLRRSGRSS